MMDVHNFNMKYKIIWTSNIVIKWLKYMEKLHFLWIIAICGLISENIKNNLHEINLLKLQRQTM